MEHLSPACRMSPCSCRPRDVAMGTALHCESRCAVSALFFFFFFTSIIIKPKQESVQSAAHYKERDRSPSLLAERVPTACSRPDGTPERREEAGGRGWGLGLGESAQTVIQEISKRASFQLPRLSRAQPTGRWRLEEFASAERAMPGLQRARRTERPLGAEPRADTG